MKNKKKSKKQIQSREQTNKFRIARQTDTNQKAKHKRIPGQKQTENKVEIQIKYARKKH